MGADYPSDQNDRVDRPHLIFHSESQKEVAYEYAEYSVLNTC
jgi:hypothetical protein